MSRIEWDESFSVNHAEIDAQHKNWINIYNRLDGLMGENDPSPRKDVTIEILQSMLDYAKYHFKFEEEYMRSIGYPARASHTRLHRECDALIYQAYMGILEGNAVLDTQLLTMINDWLLNHILVEDKKYGQFAIEAESSK